MAPQPSLFDAKVEAIGRVERHANPAWLAAAASAVERVARRQAELTTDDVWAELKDTAEFQHEARAIGPVMLRASRAGVLVATDRIRLSALGAGRWKVRVWQSAIWEGDD